MTEKDLHLIVSNGYEYLITDLIFLARTKYGGKEGLDQRLKEKKRLKMKREAEKECSLIRRESEVVAALARYGSSYRYLFTLMHTMLCWPSHILWLKNLTGKNTIFTSLQR